MKNDRYYAMSIEEIFQKFQTSEEGLSNKEAEKRIKKHGKNDFPEAKKEDFTQTFINELFNPILLILIIAVVSSFLIGEVIVAFVLIGLIIIDLFVSAYEIKRESDVKNIVKELMPYKARINRLGTEQIIKTKDLTVGDYVFLCVGDKVPADIRITSSKDLTVNESIITGKYTAIDKNNKMLPNKEIQINKQTNILFAGTTLLSGECCGVVVNVGLNTEIGKITNSASKIQEEKTSLEITKNDYTKQISFIIILLTIALTSLLVLRNCTAKDILISYITLVISLVPEGLPLAVIIQLIIASEKMNSKNIIIKHASDIDTLGRCTIIASDKTGTLTLNELTAKKIVLPNNKEYLISGNGYQTEGMIAGENVKYGEELAKLAIINTNNETKENTIDYALKILGEKLGINSNNTEIIKNIPYKPSRKYSALFYKKGNDTYCTVKGTFEEVIKFCTSMNLKKDFSKTLLEEQNRSLIEEGYTTIAIATRKMENNDECFEKDIEDLNFMGLIAFIDPIRKDAVSAIKQCASAGVKAIMITGDKTKTAYKVAKDLNMVDTLNDIGNGVELESYLVKSREEFDNYVKSKKMFAEVSPLGKLQIVESLKRQGEVVASTGDGVNDIPALHNADIGISIGAGSEITQETSHAITTDNSFKSIINGIIEGRNYTLNFRKILYLLISMGTAEAFIYILSVIFNMNAPLTIIQLLFINVASSIFPVCSLVFEPIEKTNISKQKNLIDVRLFKEVFIAGTAMGVLAFVIWMGLINVAHTRLEIARTYIFIFMIIIQNVHSINCKSETASIYNIRRNNPMLPLAMLFSIALMYTIIKVDSIRNFLGLTYVLGINVVTLFTISLIIIIVVELYKMIVKRNSK